MGLLTLCVYIYTDIYTHSTHIKLVVRYKKTLFGAVGEQELAWMEDISQGS